MRYSLYLVVLLVAYLSTYGAYASLDSLRLETGDSLSYVIHEVEPGETIFSLSRRYSSTVDQIKAQNSLQDNNLSIGQLLSIPVLKSEEETQTDTTRTVSKVHKVKLGETLYSISRLYGLSVSEIKLLNDMTDNALSVGSSLIVGELAQDSVSNDNISDNIKEIGQDKEDLPDNLHVVAAGETVYSIARKYGVDPQELRNANRLRSNYLSIGQSLLLPFAVAGEIPTENPSAVSDSLIVLGENELGRRTAPQDTIAKADAKPDTSLVADTTRTPSVMPEPVKYGNSDKRDSTSLVTGQVVEEGFAMKIENAPKTRKYLALHRTVPIGTIMQVRNQMNNQSIFVRVVGKLPDIGPNQNVLIRLTRQAFERLGAIDPKIPVEIAYMSE